MMAGESELYKKWLGIPPEHQPPNHYRLLGIELFESDADTISHAADRQMAYVKTFQSGKHIEFVQKLLNDIASARVCLLDRRRKAEYDTRLRASLGAPRWRHPATETLPTGVASSQRPAANRLQPIPVSSAPASPAAIVTPTGSVTRRLGKRSPAWLPLAVSGAVIGALLIGIVGLVMYLDHLSSRQENTESVAAAPTKSGQKAGQKEARSPKTVADDSESAGGDPDSGDKADMTPGGGSETPSSDENEAEAASPGEDAASPGEAATTLTEDAASPGEAVTSPAAEPAQDGPALSDTLAGETHVWLRNHGATLEMLTGCTAVPLRAGQRVFGFGRLEFSKVGGQFSGCQFTRWSRLGPGKILGQIRQSGMLCVIFPPKYADKLVPGLKEASFDKLHIVCTISQDGAAEEQWLVYGQHIEAPKNLDLRVPSGYFPPILVAKQILAKPTGIELSGPVPEPSGNSPAAETTPGAGSAPPASQRHSVPPSAAQAKVADKLKDIFELDKIETPADQARVAKTLLKQGKESAGDPIDQFVMLRTACELAADVNDLSTAFEAIDEIDRYFNADALAMRLKTIAAAVDSHAPLALKASTLQAALPVIDQAVADDRFAEVGEILPELQATARRLKDRSLMAALANRRTAFEAVRKEFAKAEAAQKTLQIDPDDPDANLVVGKYLCFWRNDWDHGLPMLAKGSDEALRQLAAEDLTAPDAHDAQLRLADGYFDRSEEEPAAVKAALQARAGQWYEKALPKLTGLDKVKASKRLEEIAKTTKRAEPEKQGLGGPRRGQVIATSDYRFEMFVNEQLFLNGVNTSVFSAVRVFQPGDVIIVKARRSANTRSFACVIRFEGSPQVIATGAPNSPWRSYRPNSARWAAPGQGTVLGPTIATPGLAGQRIFQNTRVRCGSIWGTYEDNPTLSYAFTYLILEIK